MVEENSYINGFKRPRRYFLCWKNADDSEEKRDRISELHESLLIKILSLLDTEEAVKTSVLSKRWKNLWTHLDNLHFHCSMLFREHFEPFLSFVDNVLTQCTSNTLKNFSLYASYEDFHYSDGLASRTVDCWLERVFKKKVKCLAIQIARFKYRPSKWFYQNSSLENLEISEWKIKIRDESVSWTSLKSLTLSRMSIKSEILEKILSGCPVLENLVLDHIANIGDLNIKSPSVRKVKIVQGQRLLSELFVDAPWIEELEIFGRFHVTYIQLPDVSSLLNVKLTFRYYWDCFDAIFLNVATGMLKTVSRVEELTLGPTFIQAISLLILSGNPSPLLPFVRCKHLTVQFSVTKHELPGIVCLLQNTPVLETLVIEMENSSQDVFEKYLDKMHHFDEGNYLSTQTVDFPHLKTVEFARHKDACRYEDRVGKNNKRHDYDLVSYLFRNARSLKKLLVTSRNERCVCSMDCPFYYASFLSRKIQSKHEFDKEWGLKKKHSTFEFSRCSSDSEPANSV